MERFEEENDVSSFYENVLEQSRTKTMPLPSKRRNKGNNGSKVGITSKGKDSLDRYVKKDLKKNSHETKHKLR